MRHWLVGSVLASLLVSCGGDSLPTLCSLTAAHLPGNELTLRSDVRLDRVGGGFMLFASDEARVLVEPVGAHGEAGALVAIPVPAHSDGPWVAAAGTAAAPGTVLIVAYAANPVGGTADLMTFTAGLDGVATGAPVAVGKIPDKGLGPVVVAAGSGRGGQHAGITWGVSGTTTIWAKILGPDGRPVGGVPDLSVGQVDDFDCLRFGPGKGDLTISYTASGGTPPAWALRVAEIDAGGANGPSLNMTLGKAVPGCPAYAPSTGGYGFAWKEIGTAAAPGQGDFFALYDETVRNYVPRLVLSNPRAIGGVAPPIVGVGTSGNRFTLLFSQASGAEAWEVDFEGRQVATSVTYPSAHGNIGAVAAQPVGSTLVASYADYASPDPSNQTTGDRLFVELTCRP